MKVIIETDKQSGKPPKRPYMTVKLGQYDFVYDAKAQENLEIYDSRIYRNMQNHLSISAYKSEKQYKKFTGQKGETAKTVFNVIMIIFTVLMIILSFGLFFSYLGKKGDPGLKFSYSFNYDPTKNLKITIKDRIMSMQYFDA